MFSGNNNQTKFNPFIDDYKCGGSEIYQPLSSKHYQQTIIFHLDRLIHPARFDPAFGRRPHPAYPEPLGSTPPDGFRLAFRNPIRLQGERSR